MSPARSDADTEKPHERQSGPSIVVGQGSIGLRHAEVLRSLGHHVTSVSRRPGFDHVSLADALAALDPAADVPYVVIATETEHHLVSLDDVESAGFVGPLLIEKPLFHRASPRPPRDRTFVGYNLRFHPGLASVREFCRDAAPISVQIHAGQDIRTWRPGRDIQNTASATPRSGGVLRDLSHELDYILWILGPWRRVAAIGGVRTSLGLASDDVFHVMLEMESGVIVSLELNYLDAPARRTIHATSESGSLHADLIEGTVLDRGTTSHLHVERNDTYRLMHQAIIHNPTDDRLCSMDQGVRVVELIDAIERANADRAWIDR